MYSLLQIFLIWLFIRRNYKVLILSSLFTIYLVIYLLIDVVSSDGFNLAALYQKTEQKVKEEMEKKKKIQTVPEAMSMEQIQHNMKHNM